MTGSHRQCQAKTIRNLAVSVWLPVNQASRSLPGCPARRSAAEPPW